VLTQSFFQRRRGLATLVATTAAGSEQVTVLDVPVHLAVALADSATPGMLTAFLRDSPGPRLG
jgi:putative membrane protein